jgi:hypothetical protein
MPVITTNWTESEGVNPLVLFDNLLADATLSFPSTEADASAVQTESTYDGFSWSNNNRTFTFDLGSGKDFYALAIVGYKGPDREVKLLASNDGSDYTEINSSVTYNISTSSTTMIIFNSLNRRYFRLRFVGDGDSELRALSLGSPLEIDCGIGYGYTPIWLAQEKELLVSKTMNGQFVGNRVVSKGAMTDVPLLAVERSFVEDDLMDFMKHYNEGRPFVFAGGPTVFPNDVAYCWRQQRGEMRPNFDQSGNWMSIRMSIEGYVA